MAKRANDTAQAARDTTPPSIPESADASILSAHNALVERVDAQGIQLDTILDLVTQLASLVPTSVHVDAKGKPAPAPVKGKTEPVKSKAAAKRARVETGASNSAKYTCSCGGWGVQEGFKSKHEVKGHTITQLH